MANKRTLTIEFLTEDGQMRKGFASLPAEAEKAGDGIVSKFRGKLSGLSTIGSDILGGFLGGSVVAGFSSLGTAVSGIVSEYQESVKVGAQTAAVIKSTGGAAHVTANQVGNLSERLSEKIGIDDEIIQRGANVLLTFTNVRNEVGRGNKVFDQAVRLSEDMSVALGQDVKSSSIQLGKALNDPIKGLTALQRVGVTFSQKQKDQIQWATFFGDKLSAQKVILGEVRKEFGDSAAAQATWLDKLKVKFANFQEGLGRWTAETAVPWLREMWPKVVDAWNDGVAKAREIIEPFVAIVQTLWARFGDNIVNFAKGAWNAIRDVISGVFRIIKGIFDFFLAVIQGDWGAAWSALGEIVSGAWQAIIGEIEWAWNEIKLIVGIAWETLTAIFGGLWGALTGMVSDAWNGIVGFVVGGVSGMVNTIAGAPGAILGLAGDFLNAGMALGGAIIGGIKDGASAVFGFAGDIATAILGAFKDGWNSVANAINDFIPDEIFVGALGFGYHINLPDNPIPKFHSGGLVPGRPGQEMLAVLQAGERVIPARQVGRTDMRGRDGVHINVIVQGNVTSEQDLARTLLGHLKDAQTRGYSTPWVAA